MTRIEALLGSLIIGLLLCMGLVVWGHAVAQQEPPSPAPPSQGDDPHAGQPDHCTNAKDAPQAHRCECSKAEEEDGGKGCDVEDVKCRVYCRKDHCHCFHPRCDS